MGIFCVDFISKIFWLNKIKRIENLVKILRKFQSFRPLPVADEMRRSEAVSGSVLPPTFRVPSSFCRMGDPFCPPALMSSPLVVVAVARQLWCARRPSAVAAHRPASPSRHLC